MPVLPCYSYRLLLLLSLPAAELPVVFVRSALSIDLDSLDLEPFPSSMIGTKKSSMIHFVIAKGTLVPTSEVL